LLAHCSKAVERLIWRANLRQGYFWRDCAASIY
jgi:hypothetical protein